MRILLQTQLLLAIFNLLALTTCSQDTTKIQANPFNGLMTRVVKSLQSPDRRTRNYAAFILTLRMLESGTDRRPATSFFQCFLKNSVEVEIPQLWLATVSDSLMRESNFRSRFYENEQPNEYKFSATEIVGPDDVVYVVRENFAARETPLFTATTDSHFAAVGIRERGLSPMLLFDVKTTELIGECELYFSQKERNARRPPDPLSENTTVLLDWNESATTLYVFSIVGSGYAIASIVVGDEMLHEVIFSTNGSLLEADGPLEPSTGIESLFETEPKLQQIPGHKLDKSIFKERDPQPAG